MDGVQEEVLLDTHMCDFFLACSTYRSPMLFDIAMAVLNRKLLYACQRVALLACFPMPYRYC